MAEAESKPLPPLEELVRDLRAAGLDAWDHVDVEETFRELRGDEEIDELWSEPCDS